MRRLSEASAMVVPPVQDFGGAFQTMVASKATTSPATFSRTVPSSKQRTQGRPPSAPFTSEHRAATPRPSTSINAPDATRRTAARQPVSRPAAAPAAPAAVPAVTAPTATVAAKARKGRPGGPPAMLRGRRHVSSFRRRESGSKRRSGRVVSGFARPLRLIVGVVGRVPLRPLGFIGGAGPGLLGFSLSFGGLGPGFPFCKRGSLLETSDIDLRYGVPCSGIAHTAEQAAQARPPSEGGAIHEHQPACCAAQLGALPSDGVLRVASRGLAARVSDSKGPPLNTGNARGVVPKGCDGVVEGADAH